MKLLTVNEVAELLNVPSSTIYHFSYLSKIPVIRIGGKMLRFEEKAILDWIKSFEHQPTVQSPAVKPEGKRERGRPKNSTKVKTSLVELAKKEILKG